jgi:membrane-bound lytic murein transglycosylase C
MRLLLSLFVSSLLCAGFSVQAKDIAQECHIQISPKCTSAVNYSQQDFVVEPGFASIKFCKQAAQRIYTLEKNCLYDGYVAKANNAMKEYKAKVLAIWGDEKVSDVHSWVSYGEQLNQRSEMDYKTGTIEISSIGSHNHNDMIKIAEQELNRVLSLTKAEAEKADPFISVIIEDTSKKDPFSVDNVSTFKPRNAKVVAINSDAAKPLMASVMTPADIVELVSKAKVVQVSKSEITAKVIPTRTVITVSFPNNWVYKRAQELKPLFVSTTQAWQIDPALGLAMMFTESSFNPMARSPVPAYGLMQVVPTSAGLDVNHFIFSKKKSPTPQQLYIEQENLKFGGGYLKLLRDRYFNKILDPLSKKYCMIAAYNTGPGNVAKTFTGSVRLQPAIDEINRLTPEQVKQKLINNLPYEETRLYLQKVLSEEQRFSSI